MTPRGCHPHAKNPALKGQGVHIRQMGRTGASILNHVSDQQMRAQSEAVSKLQKHILSNFSRPPNFTLSQGKTEKAAVIFPKVSHKDENYTLNLLQLCCLGVGHSESESDLQASCLRPGREKRYTRGAREHQNKQALLPFFLYPV